MLISTIVIKKNNGINHGIPLKAAATGLLASNDRPFVFGLITWKRKWRDFYTKSRVEYVQQNREGIRLDY